MIGQFLLCFIKFYSKHILAFLFSREIPDILSPRSKPAIRFGEDYYLSDVTIKNKES